MVGFAQCMHLYNSLHICGIARPARPCDISRNNLCKTSCAARLSSTSFLVSVGCRHSRRSSRGVVRNTVGNTQESEQVFASNGANPVQDSDRLKQTLADLDALLGIEEETEKPKVGKLDNGGAMAAISVGPEVLQKLLEAEFARMPNLSKDEKTNLHGGLSDQMIKIMEEAHRLSEQGSAGKSYLKKDIKKLKEQVFGPLQFWVAEVKPALDPEGGILVRGKMRGEQTKVFEDVCAGVQRVFGDKYTVFLIEDPEVDMFEGGEDAGGRPVFQIAYTHWASPSPAASWQKVAAVVLLVLTVMSCIQVGLVANLAKLPRETVEWLARPDAMAADSLPPGLAAWNPVPYLQTAVPVMLGVLGVQLAREAGHRVMAALKKVKLGPSYFIPNANIGSLGSSTPFESVLKNRTDLFDISVAGLAAGGAASLLLFALGIMRSQGGDLPQELLVPVPSQLFQGSVLLGTLSRLGLGNDTMRSASVYVHPFVIAGWCGLVGTALNSLPVGSVDGGRMAQAAFGRSALSVTGFFTYVGLGLGLLGSSLSLPFGLYVLICQRTAEKYVQDNLSPVSDARRVVAAVLILTALLILLPMAPELADTVGVGPQGPFL